MALTAALDRYYLEIAQHGADPASYLKQLALIAQIIGPQIHLSAIDDDKIALMVARLRGRKNNRGKLLANGTVNRYTEALRRVWKRAAKIWKVDVGDEPDWGAHLLEEADERVRDLAQAEEAKLLDSLREDMRPMVRFSLMSGLRLANVRMLTWKSVDFEAQSITIKMKSKKPGGRVHTIPLTTAMIALLANERGHHPIYVFTYECRKSRDKRRKGERYPFSRDGWRKAWDAARKAAGLEDFRFHDNRHTAATRIVRATGNLKIAQKLLGHTEITTTSRYAHALTEDVRNAMEAAQSRNIPSTQDAGSQKGKSKQSTKGR